jgi:uncharacterized protein YqgV (UPF0045/DUF77 family)
MRVEAEVSLYPLGQERLSPFIDSFVDVLRKHGCEADVGLMSTLVKGDTEQVFGGLRAAYEAAACEGGCVLIVHASNACPT